MCSYKLLLSPTDVKLEAKLKKQKQKKIQPCKFFKQHDFEDPQKIFFNEFSQSPGW